MKSEIIRRGMNDRLFLCWLIVAEGLIPIEFGSKHPGFTSEDSEYFSVPTLVFTLVE
jgi:hypothetical protein